MREIIFRGKRIDNGEWVEGLPFGSIYGGFSNGAICSIRKAAEKYGDVHSVVIETVGQYTGLTDKNGNKIFEGDIVQLHYFYEEHDPTTLGAYEAEQTIVATISVWDMGVGFNQVGGNLSGYLHDWLESPQDELEVIGNIHDNLELLEV